MKSKFLTCFLTLAVVWVYSCRLSSEHINPPRAVAGVLDLTAWSFEEDGPVNLSGQYEFYWNQLHPPHKFDDEDPRPKPAFIQVPGLWNGLETGGEVIPGTGYATYRLTVLLKGKHRSLALKVLDMSTACSLFVNRKRVYSAGEVGESPVSSKPQFNPGVIDFQTDESKLELIIQVSNFHHRKGGAWESIFLGTEKQIRNSRETKVTIELFLFGSILIMGLYHLGLFILRRKERSTLFFGIFCLLIALRILTTGERYFLKLFPDFSWAIFVKLEYLSYYLAVIAFAHFFYALFFHRFFKTICLAATILGSIFSALVILLPLKYFSQTLTPYHLLTLSLFIYGIYILLIHSWKKEYDAIIFLGGFIVLISTAINDMLTHENLLQTGNLVPLGLLIFIFSQAFLLSLRFSKAFEMVDIQHRKLRDTNHFIRKQIKQSKQAAKALKASHERFLSVLDSIDADIYVADMSNYEVLFMNQHMKDSFGHDYTGQTCWQAFRNDSKVCGHCTNHKLLNSDGDPSGVHVWDCKNPITGRWYTNYDRAIPWEDITGNTRFVRLQIATDITEKKQAETALQNAKDELEKRVQERTDDILRTNQALRTEIKERIQAQEATVKAKRAEENANRAKSAFLANMSHELRTPLNHILGFTELILDKHFGELNEIQTEYLGDVHLSGEHLLSLINDILDISKIESGKQNLQLVDTNIKSLIQNSLIMIKRKAEQKSIELAVEMDGVPHTIRADERSIKQIMYNLLSNAVKFTPDNGQITIRAQVCPFGDKNRPAQESHRVLGLQISVFDSGIGIEPENLTHIFEPFEQVENSTSRKYQGTGLGLSLSKNLVGLHGGKMWADSDGEGKGSAFHFVIPI